MPKKPHRLERIADAVTSTPWAILPDKLDEICAFFDRRLEGELLSEEEIRAAIGGRDDEESDPTTVDGVRIISVRGTITPKATLLSRFSGGASCESICAALDKAATDGTVHTVLLRLDTPGGSVHGVAETARKIFELRQKKKVVAWVDNGLAASAGYWIGSAASEFYATEGSEVGSIGVIMVHREVTQWAEKVGMKYTVLRSVENKAIGQAEEALDEKKAAVMMERIQGWHSAFVEAVARHRGVTEATVNETFGRGKTFRAEGAVGLGMIDGVRTFSQVFDSLRSGGGGSGVSTKEVQVNERIKAALVAQGIIPNMQTSDETAEACLNTLFHARGESRPEKDDEVVKAILAGPKSAATDVSAQNSPSTGGQGQGAGGNVTSTGAIDAEKITAAERERWANLAARGKLLGISAEQVTEAQEQGWTLEAALSKWTEAMEKENSPIDPTSTRQTGSAYDAFVLGASDAILQQLGAWEEGAKPSEQSKDFRHMRMVDIARTGLGLANVRVPAGQSAEETCEQFLKLSGTANVPMAAGAGPTYGPGHYPDLMSNVANRMINTGAALAPATYPEWTSRLPSVPDFRPKTIINTGAFGLFSHILDGKEVEESEFKTEHNWISVDRFGDKVKLTPVMMANDDLDAWSQAIQGLGTGAELTINAAAISLLFSTANLPDGLPLFSLTRPNIISGGGAPSIAQADKARMLMRGNKEPSNRLRVSVTPAVALVPTKHETAAEQFFMPRPVEVAEQAANINTFRGKVKPVCDAMLDDYDPNAWFEFANPQLYRGICVLRQTGYETGKRRKYWDEATQCLMHEYEIRFAVGIADWRMGVKNPGS